MEPNCYASLIANQKAALKKANLRKGEIPTDRPTKNDLIQGQLMCLQNKVRQGLGNGKAYQVLTTFIPPAYPPCTTPLAKLKNIMVKDLKLETHHRGKYLLGKVLTPPDRMAAIMTIVEDEDGEAVLLQLYQQELEMTKAATKILGVGMVVVIKEPFFKQTASGGYGVRIDHVSDILWLAEDDNRRPVIWQPRLRELKTALEWKEEGNLAINKNDVWAAINLYTAALAASPSTDDIEVIKRNRAFAYLQIENFDAALSDLGYPFLGDVTKQPEKSLYRSSVALYGLQRYRECFDVLQILRQVYTSNTATLPRLKCVETRLRELERGEYDFKVMYAEVKRTRPLSLDHATYIGPVKIQKSEGRGRGLFLTKDVKAGELLFCEKAFSFGFAPDENDISENHAPNLSILLNAETDFMKRGTDSYLIQNIVQKLAKNPSLAPALFDLYHGSYKGVSSTESCDGVTVVDTFLVERIIELNAFCSPITSLSTHLKKRDKNKLLSSGLWIKASYINHSCVGNCRRAFIGDMQIARATEDMVAGTELLWPYVLPKSDDLCYNARQKYFKSWGFTCSCALCLDAKFTNNILIERREKLENKLQQLIPSLSNMEATTKHLKVSKVESILVDMERCYPKHPFGPVPSTGLWDPYLLLLSVYSFRGQAQNVITATEKALAALSFSISGLISPKEDLVVHKWGLIDEYLVMCWCFLWTAYAFLGQSKKAEAARCLAMTSYKIIVGEDETFEKEYGEKVKTHIASGNTWRGF